MTVKLGPYTEGEIPPPLVEQFTDSDGVVIPLAGFSAVFVIDPPGSTAAFERAAVVDEAAATATYTWLASDFATPGTYAGQMWVGNAGELRLASNDYEWDVETSVGGLVPNI